MTKNRTIIILGASIKEGRYSNIALKKLIDRNFNVIPVHPTYKEIEGLRVLPDLKDIEEKVDTITIYINPDHLEKHIDDIIKLKPKRVIFNPGSESASAIKKLDQNNIKYLKSCTLVLLRTNQF